MLQIFKNHFFVVCKITHGCFFLQNWKSFIVYYFLAFWSCCTIVAHRCNIAKDCIVQKSMVESIASAQQQIGTQINIYLGAFCNRKITHLQIKSM